MTAPQVGDEVQFLTNSDTIADNVDGRTGIVIRTGSRCLLVSVEGYTIATELEQVQLLD